MSDELVTGLLTAAAMVVVGLLALIGVMVRNRNNEPEENPGELRPAAKTAVNEVRRDLRDTNNEICKFHARLERHMESQSKASQDQTAILNDIKSVLEHRLPRMNTRPGAGAR